MAEQPGSDTAYAAYEPYVEEILDLYHQQIRRNPHPHVLQEAWRIGFVTLLVDLICGLHMLPEDMDQFLAQICAEITADTRKRVRGWDDHGPRSV